MLRLLIADDEADKLDALRDNFDWEKYDIKLCGEARDGMEAYEQLVSNRPDICIMDIRMPIISGLEAMRRAKAQGCVTKFIVLSGYDEFGYAREALALSSVEYLLKPCKAEEIMGAVIKSIGMINAENRQRSVQTSYENLVRQNLKQQLLRSLMLGSENDSAAVAEQISVCNLEALRGNFAVCIFEPEANAMSKSAPIEELVAMIKSSFAEAFSTESVILRERVAAVVGMDNICDRFAAFDRALQNIVDLVRENLRCGCTVGVSDIVGDSLHLHEAFLEAEGTVKASQFLSRNPITFFAEMDSSVKFKYPDRIERRICSAIGSGEREIEEIVGEFFSSCEMKTTNVKNYIQETAITLIYNICKTCSEHGSADLGDLRSQATKELLACDCLCSVKAVTAKFILSISEALYSSKGMSSLAKKALYYINYHYGEHISLKSVSDEIHVTPTYMSSLFKQQTGLNFVDYLNQYRIEKSKECLRQGDRKIYEIAHSVGFQDEKYFSLMFKRYTGFSPAQYRESFLWTEEAVPLQAQAK